MKKIAYLLTLVFCLSLIPFSPVAAQPLVNWSGTWETDWGKLTLYQVGDKVTGNYEHDQGKIVGYVQGKMLIGTWSEAPSYSAPKDAGDLKWVLAVDGKSFSGKWCYSNYQGKWNGDWKGTKKIQPKINESGSWGGVWQSSWGKMTLQQNGNQIIGNYEHDQGKITGYIEGNTLIGTWSEAPSYSAPNDAGDVKLILSDDSKSLSGNWCYGSYNGSWNGSWEASKN